MPWLRLDDRFPKHRKVVNLSDRAFRLHVSAMCHCAEELTDGKIRPRDLGMVAASIHLAKPNKYARELVDAGLWLELDDAFDGYEIKDYLDYNPTAAKVLEERRVAAERQRERRAERTRERTEVRT